MPAGATVTGVNFVLDPWTGVVVKVTDAAGTPLQNINWNLYEYRPTEGDWLGRQYGPLLTGADGTFAEGTDVGTTYKICVYDTWYYDWAPATRYQDRCYDGAATLETATPFTVTTDTRRRGDPRAAGRGQGPDRPRAVRERHRVGGQHAQRRRRSLGTLRSGPVLPVDERQGQWWPRRHPRRHRPEPSR